MRYRTLGRTGLRVSEVGMGGIGAMGKYGAITPGEFARTMTRAAELGMNFLDTAPSYGESETVFGHYLKENRDRWIVCTKVGGCGNGFTTNLPTLSGEALHAQFSQSLKRLQVDYADVVLIHSIDQYGIGEAAVERILSPGGMVEALRELQAEGKVRFIGVSGLLPELLPAVRSGVFDVVLTYNTFNLLIQEAQQELFPLAQEMNVGVILAGAFYQGLLSGQAELVLKNKGGWFGRKDPGYYETEKLMEKVQRLLAFAGSDFKALRQLSLRFALFPPAVSVVVTGMHHAEEVEENAEAVEKGALSEEECEALLGV